MIIKKKKKKRRRQSNPTTTMMMDEIKYKIKKIKTHNINSSIR